MRVRAEANTHLLALLLATSRLLQSTLSPLYLSSPQHAPCTSQVRHRTRFELTARISRPLPTAICTGSRLPVAHLTHTMCLR
ncbi:uncharacterized protein C8Q71DRAFT_735305 [Rhodofomes roseus]|uniref:Secreted protein n=1 Tax=Rhodofomes roseus TaxID=34475 RepID=A0ABQ8KX53_9APHY|nr:uncharacterized protein C8Q71DRAFT_735305 [Rhodofomes roseus]KAH9842948.1 hypothetical protein C8Q71DRAFT_735305 [Rhodofomes roseus]